MDSAVEKVKSASAPSWLLEKIDPEKQIILYRRCTEAGLDVLDQAWRCDEYWQDRDAHARKKVRPRWYSRFSNWLDRSISGQRQYVGRGKKEFTPSQQSRDLDAEIWGEA